MVLLYLLRRHLQIEVSTLRALLSRVPCSFPWEGSEESARAFLRELREVGAVVLLRDLAWPHALALGRGLAAHPSAPAALLARLALAPDEETARLVCAHPSTPLDTLEWLGQVEPQALRQNPILDLLSLEDPALPQLSWEVLAALLRAEGPSARLLPAALRFPGGCVQVARSDLSRLPVHVLDRVSQASPEARDALAANLSAPPALLARLATPGDSAARLVARNPVADAALLESLRAQQRPELRASLAANPAASPALLLALYLDGHATPGAWRHEQGLWRELALHPYTPQPVLFALAGHPSLELRGALAARPDLDPRTLARLVTDLDPPVRSQARRNPGAPRALLSRLWRAGASDDLREEPSPQRQAALSPEDHHALPRAGAFGAFLYAMHPEAAPAVLCAYASGLDEWLRAAVAARPGPPPGPLARLLDALQLAGAKEGLAGYHPNSQRHGVAPERLAPLAHAGPWGMRLAALHPDTAPEDLALIVSRACEALAGLVRGLAAPAPTREEEAARLSSGHFSDWRHAREEARRAALGYCNVLLDALEQPHTPASALHTLWRWLDETPALWGRDDPAQLHRERSLLCGGLALHPRATPALLRELARAEQHTPDAELRLGLALHARTPPEVVDALAQELRPAVPREDSLRLALARRASRRHEEEPA